MATRVEIAARAAEKQTAYIELRDDGYSIALAAKLVGVSYDMAYKVYEKARQAQNGTLADRQTRTTPEESAELRSAYFRLKEDKPGLTIRERADRLGIGYSTAARYNAAFTRALRSKEDGQ